MKDDLVERLRAADFAAILGDSHPGRGLLGRLTGLSYHPEAQVADRAVQVFGLAAAAIAAEDPEYVRSHLRRLFWLMNDESGGICPRAPEMIGETLANCPGRFDEFMPLLASLLDLEPEDAPRFRAGVLRALARIATSEDL